MTAARSLLVLVICLAVARAEAQCGCVGIVAIGDSRTADRHDGQQPWPSQVVETAVSNAAVSGAQWAACATQMPTSTVRLVIQCGVNDIIALNANGTTLWGTVQSFIDARSALGLRTWVMNMPGFKGYDSTPARLTQRNNFNAAFTTYCGTAHTGVTCIDIATPLWDPADHDSLLGAYTIEGLHFTTAGHAVIAAAFDAAYP